MNNNEIDIEELNLKLEEIEDMFSEVKKDYYCNDIVSNEVKSSFENWCEEFKRRL